jgi:hypothetical protein
MYMNGLIEQLVRRIEALQEEMAAPAIYKESVPAETVCERLDDMLQVEDPGGKTGTLTASDDGWSIFLDARITSERIISKRPGDFNGVVWSEEMDRAPREDGER